MRQPAESGVPYMDAPIDEYVMRQPAESGILYMNDLIGEYVTQQPTEPGVPYMHGPIDEYVVRQPAESGVPYMNEPAGSAGHELEARYMDASFGEYVMRHGFLYSVRDPSKHLFLYSV